MSCGCACAAVRWPLPPGGQRRGEAEGTRDGKQQDQEERVGAIGSGEAAAEARARRRRQQRWLMAGAAAIAVVVAVVVVVARDGDDGARSGSPDGAESFAPQTTPPPWSPTYTDLAERIEALGFPAVGDESYHAHALLSVFVDGEQAPVPANIGIDEATRTVSPLHTHEPNGVVHMEADDPYPFTLGQVFAVWGVAFADGQLGGLRDAGSRSLQVYVNGERVTQPAAYELKDQDNVVVAYGEPGSFPTEPPADALAGA